MAKEDIKYKSAGFDRTQKENLKKLRLTFIPSNKFLYIFLAIITASLLISATKFPISGFMSGNTDAEIIIGYPLNFVEFTMSGETSNFFMLNLIIDLAIYVVLSYIINVLANVLTEFLKLKNGELKSAKPSVFKNKTENKIQQKEVEQKSESEIIEQSNIPVTSV